MADYSILDRPLTIARQEFYCNTSPPRAAYIDSLLRSQIRSHLRMIRSPFYPSRQFLPLK